MVTTKASGTLRILTGAAIMAVTGYAGFLHRSPWVILLFGVVFTVLYVHGKLPQWRMAFAGRGLGAVLRGLLVTAPVQIILAGLVYLIGYGLGSLMGDAPLATALTGFDLQLALGLLGTVLMSGFAIHALERRPGGKDSASGGRVQPVNSQT